MKFLPPETSPLSWFIAAKATQGDKLHSGKPSKVARMPVQEGLVDDSQEKRAHEWRPRVTRSENGALRWGAGTDAPSTEQWCLIRGQ